MSPLFAAEDWHVALAAAVPTVLAMLGSAAVWWFGYRRQSRRDALAEWQQVIRWQAAQIDSYEHRLERCRGAVGKYRESVTYLHGVATFRGEVLRSRGVEGVEELRALEHFIPEEEPESVTRQARQNTELLRGEARQALPPGDAGG